MTLFFHIQEQLERAVKEVAAAAGRVEHSDRREFVVESGGQFALARFPLAAHERRGEIALQLASFAAERRH